MSSEDFLNYISQFNINDIYIKDDILAKNDGSDFVNIKNFKFEMLFSNQNFNSDLKAMKIDSTILINIIKAIILALSKYDFNVMEYQDSYSNYREIPSDTYLKQLAINHFHMNQAYTYLPPNIKNVVSILNDIIENPITPNDLAVQEAYYKILDDYELAQTGNGRSYVLRNGNVNYDDEENISSNELGFISIGAIILIIVNLGIIIGTLIINH